MCSLGLLVHDVSALSSGDFGIDLGEMIWL